MAAAGVPAGVLIAPMIPALNDAEMEHILDRRAGCRRHHRRLHDAAVAARTKALFKEWLEQHFPAKAAHVLSLVAQTHGGRLYDSTWSKRMVGTALMPRC